MTRLNGILLIVAFFSVQFAWAADSPCFCHENHAVMYSTCNCDAHCDHELNEEPVLSPAQPIATQPLSSKNCHCIIGVDKFTEPVVFITQNAYYSRLSPPVLQLNDALKTVVLLI